MEGLEAGRPVVILQDRQPERGRPADAPGRGYEAYVMEGSSEAWVAQGLPFTTPDGQPGCVA